MAPSRLFYYSTSMHFNFPLSQHPVHHFPTWVQVNGLSLKSYNMETTKYIGDKLGKFICYDEKSPFNGFGLHLKIFLSDLGFNAVNLHDFQLLVG